MRTLKMLWLMIVCFYYAVLTPGSIDEHRGEEQYLWGAVTVSVLQALVGAALYFFFDWPSDLLGTGASPNSFLVGMVVFSCITGGWTFVGALMYPSLSRMIRESQEAAMWRSRGIAYEKEIESRYRASEDKIAFRRLSEENPEAAIKELKKAQKLLKKGKGHKIKSEYLQCPSAVGDERRRLIGY